MTKPHAEEIRAKLEQRRERAREGMRRDEAAMDALAMGAWQSLADGIRVMAADPDERRVEPAVEATAAAEAAAKAEVEAGTRRAIEARRLQPASSAPAFRTGEPPLRAALRGVVEDYAEALTPPAGTLEDLEAMSGIALVDADSYGMWADLQLKAARAVRAAMPAVVDRVTARAESVIIAELVATEARLACEYPDAPRPDAPDPDDHIS